MEFTQPEVEGREVIYILCHGWEVDTGIIQPEVEGSRSDSPRVTAKMASSYSGMQIQPLPGRARGLDNSTTYFIKKGLPYIGWIYLL